MFDRLYEGSPALYLLLGGVTALLLTLWWRSRKRHWLYGTAGVSIVLGIAFLLHTFVDTEKKQLQRTIEGMAAAVQSHNVEEVFAHVSEQFRSPRGRSKTEFRNAVEPHINQITTFTVWDIKLANEGTPVGRTARVAFSVKATGPTLGNAQNVGYRCEATFDRDLQKGWQLRSFQLFPISSRDEIMLPF